MSTENDEQNAQSDSFSRRDFVKTSAAATAGLMASGNFAYGGPVDDTMRLGLIGCGGRGTGAAINAVKSSPRVELMAMGDLFPDRLKKSKKLLKENIGDNLTVTSETSFTGFDAYKQVLDTDIDIALLTTPPGFRPMMFRAAVEAGKHAFMEKPVAVDPTGARSIMETAKMAEEKNLGVLAGTQRRHNRGYREIMRRIHEGEIGDLVSGNVYFMAGARAPKEKKEEWSDMEWQIRNWYFFTWLSGDGIVEQHVHNIDLANWAVQDHPKHAIGYGGRQVRTDPSAGHIWDHFSVEYEYPDGQRISSMSEQMPRTYSRSSEYFVGTKGTATTDKRVHRIDGQNFWEYEEDYPSSYELEHADLIASIREGDPINEGQRIAESVMTGIMGREAAYTGQKVTWEQMMNSEQDLMPKRVTDFFSIDVPPVAKPGITEINRNVLQQASSAAETLGG